MTISQPIFNHIDIAILTRVNDVAKAYGVKPYNFTTTYIQSHEQHGGNRYLSYDGGGPEDLEAFERMVESVCGVGNNVLIGEYPDLLKALDRAIDRSPRRPTLRIKR